MKILKRVVTALTTAGLIVGALLALRFCCEPATAMKVLKPVVILLAFLVQVEYGQMVSKKYPVMVWPGVIAGFVYLVSSFYGWTTCVNEILFLLALCALFGRSDRPIAAFATTVLGFFYIPWMLRYFVMIPCLATPPDLMWLFYILAIIKISDMGGFAFGVAFGRHKMCPSISPNKSWEGMAGSIFASCLISWAFTCFTGFPLWKSLAFGAAAAMIGTLGDLVESRMKRECGVKDSSTFMPAGMGGFLDMFDSLLFAPAILFPFI